MVIHLLDVDELREKVVLFLNMTPMSVKAFARNSGTSATTLHRLLANEYDNFNQVTLRRIDNYLKSYGKDTNVS
jgi:predicted transcriptional regulator